jgi:hypothetical protein
MKMVVNHNMEISKKGREMQGKIGMANFIFLLAFAMMFFISMSFITFFTAGPDQANIVELSVDNNVYMLRDSLDTATIYLDNSARYSLYQAAYDNGRRGGYNNIESDESIKFIVLEGNSFVLWYDNADISPSVELLTNYLSEEATTNLEKYSKDVNLESIFSILLPTYAKPGITNINDYSLKLVAEGDRVLTLSRKTEMGDEITVSKSSVIDLTLHVPYFFLFKKAKEYQQELVPSLEVCTFGGLEKEEWLYSGKVELLENDGTKCVVKVAVSTKEKFLVWDGEKTVLSPVSIIFLMQKVSESLEEGPPIA